MIALLASATIDTTSSEVRIADRTADVWLSGSLGTATVILEVSPANDVTRRWTQIHTFTAIDKSMAVALPYIVNDGMFVLRARVVGATTGTSLAAWVYGNGDRP
jgi:hypothetical protein